MSHAAGILRPLIDDHIQSWGICWDNHQSPTHGSWYPVVSLRRNPTSLGQVPHFATSIEDLATEIISIPLKPSEKSNCSALISSFTTKIILNSKIILLVDGISEFLEIPIFPRWNQWTPHIFPCALREAHLDALLARLCRWPCEAVRCAKVALLAAERMPHTEVPK